VSAEDTATKQQVGRPFPPGVSGNPAGRPKGARSKLGEAFIEALHDDFGKHGVEAIQTVRTEKADQYLKVIASLLPKDGNLNIGDRELSDDELINRIRELDTLIAPFLACGETGAGEGATGAAGEGVAARVH